MPNRIIESRSGSEKASRFRPREVGRPSGQADQAQLVVPVIELRFRDLKTTMGMEVLRWKSADVVL
jgi:hypothetical protein